MIPLLKKRNAANREQDQYRLSVEEQDTQEKDHVTVALLFFRFTSTFPPDRA